MPPTETTPNNEACPDYYSHRMNAESQMFPMGVPSCVTQDEDEALTVVADAEYLACEGH